MLKQMRGKKVSDWFDGDPPCPGIWQIRVPSGIYYSRFQDGQWSGGQHDIKYVISKKAFIPYFRTGRHEVQCYRGVVE